MARRPGTKIVYGLQQHRFKHNPEEERFALAWHRQQAGKTLAYLLGDGQHPSSMVSMRDNHVAATVIQWLGSPVGQAFLEELGYEKGKVIRPLTKREERRNRKIEKLKDGLCRIRQITSKLDIELLNIDNPHG